MEFAKENKEVSLNFSSDEALVLLEWLSSLNEKEDFSLFQDQAEQRVLFDLEAQLEKIISVTFEENYADVLSKARQRVRDKK